MASTAQHKRAEGGEKKYSIPLHCLRCSHETQKCATRGGEKKGRTKTFTKQANRTAYDLTDSLISEINVNNAGYKSKEKNTNNNQL